MAEMQKLLVVLIIFGNFCEILAAGEDDRVQLPGVTFDINYGLYSGYLNAGNNGNWKMHYWLIESKSDPTKDPVLVWFQGGPGCSSFGGAFEEMGPFYINFDVQTLFENKYSWNSKANILFLESPIGVGFSYDTTNVDYSVANDTQSAGQNYQALKDFFTTVQPKYADRSFFLSGESYAGVYIPMLSARLTEGIISNDFPNKNFQGAAIGNGFMHVPKLFNSLVLWSVYHGKVSLNDWDYMKQTCTKGSQALYDVDNYDFQQYLTSKDGNGMDFESDKSKCGDLVMKAISVPDPNDAYNYYQDCYNPDFSNWTEPPMDEQYPALKHRIRKRSIVNSNPSINTATLFNYESSDTQLGYPCWNWMAVRKYANRPDVQKALHIDEAWQRAGINESSRNWHMCNGPLYEQYKITFPDQQQFFDTVLQKTQNPNFRFLIYNGDVDTVCNYLGDAWFARKVAKDNGFDTTADIVPWAYQTQLAGFLQRYQRDKDNVMIDVLTVKGAGHMVPNDRPAQSLQMINNFMASTGPNYNSTDNADPTPNLANFNPNLQKTSSAPPIRISLLFLLPILQLFIC
ncbi:unnamed protein product, partial [Mesorhabditis belari]|uniref:Carboxypeptidase n=1 Tax=Mesorhabditis belari TaxID=2138241 RepID=A0AAF3EU74_9BILA